MLAKNVKFEEAVRLLQQRGSRLDSGYDRQSAERDYVRRPDIAIVHIRAELDYEAGIDGANAVSYMKGTKIA